MVIKVYQYGLLASL